MEAAAAAVELKAGASWADDEVDEVDVPIISTPSLAAAAPLAASKPPTAATDAASSSRPPAPAPSSNSQSGIPIPDRPPFKAFVANVPHDASRDDFRAHFSAGGQSEVVDVFVLTHPDTGRPRGAFVEFAGREDLVRALERDGQPMHGRPLRVDVAEAKPDRGGGGGRERRRRGRRRRRRPGPAPGPARCTQGRRRLLGIAGRFGPRAPGPDQEHV